MLREQKITDTLKRSNEKKKREKTPKPEFIEELLVYGI